MLYTPSVHVFPRELDYKNPSHNYPNKLIILAILSGPGKPTGSGGKPRPSR